MPETPNWEKIKADKDIRELAKQESIHKTSAFNGAVDLVASLVSSGAFGEDQVLEKIRAWRDVLYTELTKYSTGDPKMSSDEEKFVAEKF